jgi:hypothetical protein
VKCKCKAAANKRELVQHTIRDEHERSGPPANPIKVISASELWRCGVALHTEKTAIKCDDAER